MKKNRLVGILGLGIFGSTLAKELSENGIDVIACDLDPKNINRLEGYLAVGSVGDFTDLEYMRELGFGQCDSIVISTGTSLEASVLGVINAKELGIETIICKVKNKINSKVITALGVDILVQPEKEAGLNMAQRLIHNAIDDIINLDNETSIVEFRVPQQWLGQSLSSLDLRGHYDINVIGIRKNRQEVLNTSFSANYIIEADDIFVAVANTEKFEQSGIIEHL